MDTSSFYSRRAEQSNSIRFRSLVTRRTRTSRTSSSSCSLSIDDCDPGDCILNCDCAEQAECDRALKIGLIVGGVVFITVVTLLITCYIIQKRRRLARRMTLQVANTGTIVSTPKQPEIRTVELQQMGELSEARDLPRIDSGRFVPINPQQPEQVYIQPNNMIPYPGPNNGIPIYVQPNNVFPYAGPNNGVPVYPQNTNVANQGLYYGNGYYGYSQPGTY